MKIAMACDHGGLRLKNVLKDDLEKNGYEVVDFGTYTEESCDYPDYASKAAKAVADGTCDKGVVVLWKLELVSALLPISKRNSLFIMS